MALPKLRVWNTLKIALAAPFGLRATSWKALGKPALAVAVVVMLPILMDQILRTGSAGWWFLFPFWATLAWFALEFQRQLLLGAGAAESTGGSWQRYGIYLLVMGFLAGFFAVFLGLLLNLVLPGITFFTMAINSPQPWMATGTLLLWSLVVLVVSYPLVRLALAFPALAAGHSMAPGRIWRITRGNGLRLLVLLVLIPGLINGAILVIVPVEGGTPVQMAVASVLEVYLALVCLALLSQAYRALSDQALPDAAMKTGWPRRFAPVLKPVTLVLVVGTGVAAVWDSVYRVGLDEHVFVSRFGKPERMESSPGLKMKMPFVEKTDARSRQEWFTTQRDRVFLTSDKQSLPLRYVFRWQIVDAERFERSVASQTRRAEELLGHAAESALRNELIRLRGTDLELLRGAGKLHFSVDQQSSPIVPLAVVIADVNARVNEIGIAVNDWDLAVVTGSP